MNVQLLLLLALVGPFCAFTHANPTPLPTHLDVGITETVADVAADATDGPEENIFTGPPVTVAPAAPEVVATEAATEAAAPAATVNVNTEEPVVETEAPTAAATAAAEATESLITDPPAVETAAPTEADKSEEDSVATAAAETNGDVVIEGDTEEGLTSGQVVGIVIGALLAVVIVIAVVIAAVRRMGKYSP